jgi:hypothetical protein
MTREDQVFVANVMVTNLTWEIVTSNVISQSANVAMKFNIIIKIRKYRRLHEGHHFIPLALKLNNTLERDMDHFMKECAYLFHNRRSRSHLSLSFCIHFFRQHVNIALQRALASVIERKIALVGDVYSRPPITIRSHDLHVDDIRGVMGEIISYHVRD